MDSFLSDDIIAIQHQMDIHQILDEAMTEECSDMHNNRYKILAAAGVCMLLNGCGSNPLPYISEKKVETQPVSEIDSGLTSQSVSFSDFLYEHYQEGTTASVLVDLTHDGEDDLLVIHTKSESETPDFAEETSIEVFTRIEGNITSIFSDIATLAVHPGYRWYYLFTEDSRHYLVQYSPDLWNGIGTYHYRVFFLKQDGSIEVVREEEADYDSRNTWDEESQEEQDLQYNKVQALIDNANQYKEIPLIELGEDLLASEDDVPLQYSYVINCGRLATVKELDPYLADDYEALNMYEVTGINQDEATTLMQEFADAVQEDRREDVLEMIRFPRKVMIPGHTVIVNSPEEFLPYYDEIFTEEFKAQLDVDVSENLNCNYMGVWLGDGEVWMMQSGNRLYVESVNVASDRSIRYPGETGITESWQP